MPLHDRIQQLLSDPSCSNWLRSALQRALERDPIDAANDAQVLANLLRESQVTLLFEGQITDSFEVRNELMVNVHNQFDFAHIAPGRNEFEAESREVTELKGMFGPPKETVSMKAMNAAFAKRGSAAR